MHTEIFRAIDRCSSTDEIFEVANEYFNGQGFGGIVYVAPESVVGPYILKERGMPAEWMARYRHFEFERVDPLPGASFRLGRAEKLRGLLNALPHLSNEERDYVDAYKKSGMTDGFAVPTYGPRGRPGLVGLAQIAHPDLLDQIDVSLISLVAQHVHSRMELLEGSEPPARLSPREREVLRWLVRGKSQSDIATILNIGLPTVVTHVKRLYDKLGVQDRANAVAMALARHYA